MAQRTSRRRRKAQLGKRLAGYSAAAGAALALGGTGADATVMFTPVNTTLIDCVGQNRYLIDFDGAGTT